MLSRMREGVMFADQYIRYVERAKYAGASFLVLDTSKTAVWPVTEMDVLYAEENGHFPDPEFLAVHPAWGFGKPLVSRRDFHDFVMNRRGRGRLPQLTFDEMREVRRHWTYSSLIHTTSLTADKVSYQAYRNIMIGKQYWWAGSGGPVWEGYSKTWTLSEDVEARITARQTLKAKLNSLQEQKLRLEQEIQEISAELGRGPVTS